MIAVLHASVLDDEERVLALQDGFAPDVEPGHLGQAALHLGRQLFVVVEVGRLGSEEGVALALLVRVQEDSVEVFIELRRGVFHQELNLVDQLAVNVAIRTLSPS